MSSSLTTVETRGKEIYYAVPCHIISSLLPLYLPYFIRSFLPFFVFTGLLHTIHMMFNTLRATSHIIYPPDGNWRGTIELSWSPSCARCRSSIILSQTHLSSQLHLHSICSCSLSHSHSSISLFLFRALSLTHNLSSLSLSQTYAHSHTHILSPSFFLFNSLSISLSSSLSTSFMLNLFCSEWYA